MSYQIEQSQATGAERKEPRTIWTAVTLKQREKRTPTRVPPGAAGRAFPRLTKERRSYSDEERRCVAEMLDRLRRGEDLRAEKVRRAREGVAGECFDREMKIEVVADRLLDVLMEE